MSTPKSALVRHKRAQIANQARYRDHDDPELAENRRELRALNLANYVSEMLAQAPPLTAEQCEEIVGLLRAGRDAEMQPLAAESHAEPRSALR